MAHIIAIENLSFGYHKTPGLLNSINLSLDEPGIYEIFGSNGSGKTTLIAIVAGMIENYSGRVQLFNIDIKRSKSYKIKCGFCLDPSFLIDKLKVIEYIEFVGAIYHLSISDAKERARFLTNMLGIDVKQGELIETLSAGEKNKVCICAALLNDPQLIVLDEPFAHLDSYSLENFKNYLDENKNCKTIIYTSPIDCTYELKHRMRIKIINGVLIPEKPA